MCHSRKARLTVSYDSPVDFTNPRFVQTYGKPHCLLPAWMSGRSLSCLAGCSARAAHSHQGTFICDFFWFCLLGVVTLLSGEGTHWYCLLPIVTPCAKSILNVHHWLFSPGTDLFSRRLPNKKNDNSQHNSVNEPLHLFFSWSNCQKTCGFFFILVCCRILVVMFVPHDEKVEIADLSQCYGPTFVFKGPVPPVPWTHSSLLLAHPRDRMFHTFLNHYQLARFCRGGGNPVLSMYSGSAAPTALWGLSILEQGACRSPVHRVELESARKRNQTPCILSELGLHSTFPLYSNKTLKISEFHRFVLEGTLST